MRKLLVAALLLSFKVTATDNLQCIQQPKRKKPCPHLLYRAAKLPGMTKTEIICICVTDFAPLIQRPQTEAEQVKYNMSRRQYAVTYGAKLQNILDILQREN